eukprot:tig00001537_g9301.t1
MPPEQEEPDDEDPDNYGDEDDENERPANSTQAIFSSQLLYLLSIQVVYSYYLDRNVWLFLVRVMQLVRRLPALQLAPLPLPRSLAITAPPCKSRTALTVYKGSSAMARQFDARLESRRGMIAIVFFTTVPVVATHLTFRGRFDLVLDFLNGEVSSTGAVLAHDALVLALQVASIDSKFGALLAAPATSTTAAPAALSLPRNPLAGSIFY